MNGQTPDFPFGPGGRPSRPPAGPDKRSRWRHGLAAALAIGLIFWSLTPRPIQAQAWFTREFCQIASPEVDPGAIDQAIVAPIAAEAAQIANGTGRLWRITSESGAISHLWGTLHSNDPLILNLPAELRRALSGARFVALEYDPIFPSRQVFDATMRGEGFFRAVEAPEAFAEIDPRVRVWIEARLDSLGWGAASLPYLTEAGMAMVLLADPCHDFAAGILLLGQEAGAEVVGLEPWNAMHEALSSANRRDAALAIIDIYGHLLNPKPGPAARKTVFGLYLQGRIGAMMALDRSGAEAFFGVEKGRRLLDLTDGYLLRERNLTFVQSALPLLKQGGAVIAVGSFHLPGDRGLITLLRNAGYRVERVPTLGEVTGP